MRISELSLQYVKVRLDVYQAGLLTDTTTAPVAFSFVEPGTAPVEWNDGDWEAYGDKQFARVMVGPGSDVGSLSAGSWDVYLKVTTSPEIPVFRVPDTLQVY
jgi:hypothetical protein